VTWQLAAILNPLASNKVVVGTSHLRAIGARHVVKLHEWVLKTFRLRIKVLWDVTAP